jgi:hypothetical protein
VSPSGSCASADAVSWRLISTVHGSQRAFTVGARFGGSAGVGGAVGVTVAPAERYVLDARVVAEAHLQAEAIEVAVFRRREVAAMQEVRRGVGEPAPK